MRVRSSHGPHDLSDISETDPEPMAFSRVTNRSVHRQPVARLRLERTRPAGMMQAVRFGADSMLRSFLRDPSPPDDAQADAVLRAQTLFEQLQQMIAVPMHGSVFDLHSATTPFAQGPGFHFKMVHDDGTQASVAIPPDKGQQPLAFAITLLSQEMRNLGPGARRTLVKLATSLPPGWAQAQAMAAIAPQIALLDQASTDRLLEALAPPAPGASGLIGPEAEWARAYGLAAFCAQMPLAMPHSQARLIELATSIAGEAPRAHALRAVAARLPAMPDQAGGLMPLFQNCAGLQAERSRAVILAGLGEAASLFDDKETRYLLKEILALRTDAARGVALGGLGSHFPLLPPGLRTEILEAIAALDDQDARATALCGLAPTLHQLDEVDRAPILSEIADLASVVLRGKVLEAMGPALASLTPGRLCDAYAMIMVGRGFDRVQIGADLKIPDLLPPPPAQLTEKQLQGVIEASLKLPEPGRAAVIVSMLAWPQRWSAEQRMGLMHMACNLRQPRPRAAAMAALLALPAFLESEERKDVMQSIMITRDDAAYLNRECRESLIESLLTVPGDPASRAQAMICALTGRRKPGQTRNTTLDGQLTKLAQDTGTPDLWRAAVSQLLGAPAELTNLQRADIFQQGLAMHDHVWLERFVQLRLAETTGNTWKYPMKDLCTALKRLGKPALILPALQQMLVVLPKLDMGSFHAVLELCGAKRHPADPPSKIDLQISRQALAELRKILPQISQKYVQTNVMHNLNNFEREIAEREQIERALQPAERTPPQSPSPEDRSDEDSPFISQF